MATTGHVEEGRTAGRARRAEAREEAGEARKEEARAEGAHLKERLLETEEHMVSRLHRRPGVATVAAAGLGLAAASLIGVGEVAVALGAGYLAYRWLHRERAGEHAGEHTSQGKRG